MLRDKSLYRYVNFYFSAITDSSSNKNSLFNSKPCIDMAHNHN